MKIISSNLPAGYFLFFIPCFKGVSFLSITCFFFFLSSCENDQKKIDDLTKRVVMKEEAIHIESFLSQSGKMKAKLKAPLMLRVAEDTVYVEFPKTMHVDFYDDSTKVETWLDSKYGKYYQNLGKVYLRDSVVVITTKGDTLRSPDLWWDQNTKLF
ncbi:MAG: hypothetical protein ABIU11_00075, partial [Chitinophagaceae bacterium]